ncbi:glycogen debranching protein GlgX [uncultured Roseibium sp.]|uniref:glycogen debranching protein GlgX n=1 Tax=uncultured Roseibium sp. TaxID=1936171 RepID=UPI002616E423|nr:glycogen debranching protein GlgX [uncultured Roseibium sp.]
MNKRMLPGSFTRLGAHFDGDGTNFALFSANAQKVELCLFSDDGLTETARYLLPERSGPVWHGYLPGLRSGTLYGYRVYGPYAPEHGHRFNPFKLLLDPYAREFRGAFRQHAALLGFNPDDPAGDLSFSKLDSAPYVPKCVVPSPDDLVPADVRPACRAEEVLIYEAHVKGLTMQHPSVPDDVRGTYDGLASEAVIEHLQKLGVTSIELLPVHAFVDDDFLIRKGLRNYWGYNTIGFFVPEPRYHGPTGQSGFRDMVKRFHAAGIEVILDVVYNHTAEGDHRGPTLGFRGIDNASYYRLIQGQSRYYVNDTGTGNTINAAHPYVLRMILDSLRYWVEVMGVDGFRFDLATTLGREAHGFDSRSGFFDALRQDPVLANVRLIAEPWDIGPGGYQLGRFPPEFGEWNDRFRDTSRKYWRGDDHSAQELAGCVLGSAGHFDKDGRRAVSSVNLVTAHDGFTLADVTRYSRRHNLDNGEDGRDGHNANFSDNFGVEGASDDPGIQARRSRRQRNLLATLFLSQGTPMLLAGDEIGNSQNGNNNAYCQDNPIGWINWEDRDETLLEFVRGLAALRRTHSSLRQSRFLHGASRELDGLRDVEWLDFDCRPLDWRDPGLSKFALILRGSGELPPENQVHDTLLLLFNRDEDSLPATLTSAPSGYRWQLELDTSEADAFLKTRLPNGSLTVQGQSVVVLALAPESDLS